MKRNLSVSQKRGISLTELAAKDDRISEECFTLLRHSRLYLHWTLRYTEHRITRKLMELASYEPPQEHWELGARTVRSAAQFSIRHADALRPNRKLFSFVPQT
jgi:hypothetical protein